MSKILAVFGATGTQGGSVIKQVLQDPELFKEYQIRAITRDVDSDKAKQLAKKVKVVSGDVHDRASLDKALTGVDAVFAMTNPNFGPNGLEDEFNAGKTIADVAVERGVEYIVFSTLPPLSKISGGKYANAAHFEAKARVEEYIRGLPTKSAFVSLGSFMDNFHNMPFLAPQRTADDTWTFSWPVSPKARMPLVHATGDTGKFVCAILAHPDRYEGKTFCAATALYTPEEMTATMSKATGKKVVFKQLALQEFRDNLPVGKDIIPDAFTCTDEFGYYGSDSEKLVAWAADNARGRPSTFEEYFQANPLVLA